LWLIFSIAGASAVFSEALPADPQKSAGPAPKRSFRPVVLSQIEMARLAERRPLHLPASIRLGRELDLERLVKLVKEGREASARKAWRKVLLGLPADRFGERAGLLIRWILGEAYRPSVRKSEEWQARASYFSEMRRLMKAHLDRARAERTRAPSDSGRIAVETDLQVLSRVRYRPGAVPLLHLSRRRLTAGELTRYLQREEDRFRKLSEDADRAGLMLQNAEHEMQKEYQMLAAMCKVLNKSAQAMAEERK
jgi:hypothetical protein